MGFFSRGCRRGDGIRQHNKQQGEPGSMNRLIGMAVVAVLLSGCVSGAKLDGMVHRAPAAEYPVALVDAVEVGEVAGGKATNPLWMTEISNDAFNGALIASLAEQ